MTELLVIRHGETDYNRQHRFQGHADVPLNSLGRTQAERLATRLASETVDAIVSSDLQRALATAQTVGRLLDLAPEVDPGWREQCFGVLEGMEVHAVRRDHALLWAQWLRYDADWSLPGGESVRTFHARIRRAVEAVAAEHRGRRVAIFTHGGVLDMLWRAATGASLHGPRTVEIPNTGVNVLRWRDGSLDVLQWADAAHLEGLPAQPSTAQQRHAEDDNA